MSIQNEAETIITQQYLKMGIQKEVYDFGHSIEAGLKERFEQIDKMAEYNQLKVIHAMQKNKSVRSVLISPAVMAIMI